MSLPTEDINRTWTPVSRGLAHSSLHFPLRFIFQLRLRLYMTIDMIALRLKLKILCFLQKLSHSRQWVRQSALHCTTEAMTIHNNQSSIRRIYMTLKCMCIFLLFPLGFFSWRPIKYDSVTPYGFFMTTDKKQQCYPLCFFSWRPIKNNSVTPYGFFHDDQRTLF